MYIKDGSDYTINIIGNPSMNALNNQLLDYAAGWVGRFNIEVDNYCINELPITSNI